MIADSLSTWLGFWTSAAAPKGAMSPMELDGYLTGVVVSPDLLLPSHWLDRIRGENEPSLDSRAKCNRALREPDLLVFAKLFENCLKRSLEAKAFSGREIGGDDDVRDFLVGHFVDVDLTRQPAS